MSSSAAQPTSRSWRWLLHLLTWAGAAGFIVWMSRADLYDPGEGVGYAMGLTGGVLMLVLLLYPLRKRTKRLMKLGHLRHWFSWHMVLGIAGPALVLLHSRLQLGSLNAKVAFWCMVVVASSGVVGRFLYARLHRGLYGQQQTLAEVRAEAETLREAVARELHQVPDVASVMADFARRAEFAGQGPFNIWRQGGLPWAEARSLRECRRRLRASALPKATQDALLWSCRKEANAAMRAAQFRGAERLFALWHVLHLPLVVILVITAIVHVLAVHMY